MATQPIIEIQHLTKRYKNADEAAVKDLNLNIHKGEIFGLLGTQWCRKNNYYFNSLQSNIC